MKPNRSLLHSFVLLFVATATMLLLGSTSLKAQLPDCVSGTVMYGLFTDSAGSASGPVLTRDSTEIRSINTLTGSVGALMGNRRYWIRKRRSASDPYFYSASAMAVDFATNRFYVMTQMTSAYGMGKDVITINTLTGAMTTIATTPASLDDYHFVKMTSGNNGYVYAIGVHRDSSSAASTFNPLIRIPTCGGAPSAGCATAGIEILGYLPSTPGMYKWDLFNGDISFDNFGNLYFATAAYGVVAGGLRYTDARLFRIAAANVPSTAGSGVIPMSLVADYNTLDSTIINGVGFDGAGSMYLSTRRYLGPQNSPLPGFTNLLYRSAVPGSATLMPAFAPPTPQTSIGDLASCYYPSAILSNNKLDLSASYVTGNYMLKWYSNGNDKVRYYEVQKSSDGVDFKTIATVQNLNSLNVDQQYAAHFKNEQDNGAQYFRIKQVSTSGWTFYSNVASVNPGNIYLSGKIKPNPFVSSIEFSIHQRIGNVIGIRISDQNGRAVYQKKISGHSGENAVIINELEALKTGVYFLEISSEDEVIREKLIKK